MPSINVDGAAARLLANNTLASAGQCLHYVWLAISQGRVHYITGGADTAYNTWLAVPAGHRHSGRIVPKDMPAFLGPRAGSSAGDVILSNGDGTFAATDWPRSRQVGSCTLAQREAQTGRHFVGWASSMGGYTLTSTTTAGSGGTPFEEDDVISDDQMNQISQMVQRATRYRLYKNSVTGAIMAFNITSGDIMDNTGGPAEITTWTNLQLVGNGENAVIVSQAEWDALRERAATIRATAGTATDVSPVLAAIAAIKVPTVPTAAEIATAVNTDAAARLAK